MAHVESGDAHEEMRERSPLRCCCRHPDAHECFMLRHPGDRSHREDQECECFCHKDELDPEVYEPPF